MYDLIIQGDQARTTPNISAHIRPMILLKSAKLLIRLLRNSNIGKKNKNNIGLAMYDGLFRNAAAYINPVIMNEKNDFFLSAKSVAARLKYANISAGPSDAIFKLQNMEDLDKAATHNKLIARNLLFVTLISSKTSQLRPMNVKAARKTLQASKLLPKRNICVALNKGVTGER